MPRRNTARISSPYWPAAHSRRRPRGAMTTCRGPPPECDLALQLRQQIVQVERMGEHLQLAVGRLRPFVLWPVPVQLDAVVIRVAQVKRFRDAVVAGAFERNA